MSWVKALAAGTHENSTTETTLRTATDKGFIYTTSYNQDKSLEIGRRAIHLWEQDLPAMQTLGLQVNGVILHREQALLLRVS
ncbi:MULTISPECIES: hypothetical protein [unclassified Pseudomonas]|uniref:hypothetical protein n=1 Tax=unclassified Pseudomonas TaxID=196821 RepID=UPI0030DC1DE3